MNFTECSIEEKSAYFLDQIELIKSIFSGRDNFYLPFTHKGLHCSTEKIDNFCDELIKIITIHIHETGQDIHESWPIFYKSFFVFCILFCDLQCNEDDWIFESFIKLSRTIQKKDGSDSVADILINDLNCEYLENDEYRNQVSMINHNYQRLRALYASCYSEWFEHNIRHSINTFLDQKGLSLFVDEYQFSSAINTLNSDIRRLKRIKQNRGVKNYG